MIESILLFYRNNCKYSEKFKDHLKTTPVNKIIFGYVGNIGMNYEFNKVIRFFEYFDKFLACL